jgi:hypothetical protein
MTVKEKRLFREKKKQAARFYVEACRLILEFSLLDGFFNGIGNKPDIPFIIKGLFGSDHRL